MIDTGSNFSVMKNPKMVVNIRDSKKIMKAETNGGVQESNQKAFLPGFFEVWFNKQSKFNILSWKDVRKLFRITAYTNEEYCIKVHLTKDKVMKFMEIESGLYIWRPEGINVDRNKNSNKPISAYSFLNLVSGNKKHFTTRQIAGAERSRDLFNKLGMPGYKKYFRALEKNQIRNCQVTVDDAKISMHIFGREPASIKGKATRQRPKAIGAMPLVEIPGTILDLHPSTAISMDYVYVQNIPMMHTISSWYKFRTMDAVRDQKRPTKSTIMRSASQVVNVYAARGLHVSQINTDNEFECIRESMRPTPMNIVAAGEHVVNIERSNRTIKERTRCHVHRLPYIRYPKEMVIGCVIHIVKCLNQLPADDGISEDQSPATLVTGAPSPDYKEITKLNFGDYVLAHTTIQKTNDNSPRSVESVALYPSGNAQGSWIFMSLLTGKRIHRYQWDITPITTDIINRVDALARDEGQPIVVDNFKYE